MLFDLAKIVPMQDDWRVVLVGQERLLPDGQVDVVVADGVMHEMEDVAGFLQEVGVALRPGGYFVVVDGVVPAGRKKRDQATRAYLNALAQFQNPAHVKYRHRFVWHKKLQQAGFRLLEETTHQQTFDLDTWGAHLSPVDLLRLRVLVRQAPAGAQAVLTPTYRGDRIQFCLPTIVLIGQLL